MIFLVTVLCLAAIAALVLAVYIRESARWRREAREAASIIKSLREMLKHSQRGTADALTALKHMRVERSDPFWVTYSVPVDPDAKTMRHVVFVKCGLALQMDFGACDLGDEFIIIVKIMVQGADSAEFKAVMSEYHVVALERPTSDRPRGLVIDGAYVGPSPIALVEPQRGPWDAEILICQTRGHERQLRYMLV